MQLEAKVREEIFEAIQSFQTIIIHRHQRPDPDAIGSQLGLKSFIKELYPEKNVLAAGTMSEGLTWMGQMDSVELADYQNALAIVLDTANQPRIDGEWYQEASKLIKIDHHLIVDLYGDWQWVDESASSCAEVLCQMIFDQFPQLNLTKEVAELFYAGIVGDTGRFQFSNTRSETFEVVSRLMHYGIDLAAINQRFNELTKEELDFMAFVMGRIVLHPAGVASVLLNQSDFTDFGVKEEASNQITHIPGRIKGVLSWVIFIQQAGHNGNYRARIRSKGPSINEVAMHFDGGGHAMASGAKVADLADRQALIQELIQTNRDYLAQSN